MRDMCIKRPAKPKAFGRGRRDHLRHWRKTAWTLLREEGLDLLAHEHVEQHGELRRFDLKNKVNISTGGSDCVEHF